MVVPKLDAPVIDSLEAAALEVAARLRARLPVPDQQFDRFLPDDLREASPVFWTPLEVILRAAQWLDEVGVKSVVDIGSGAGKFCVVGALASRCSFIGIEQRPRLVSAARDLAHRFGVEDRVRFVPAVFGELTTPVADAYYLFNSFGENLFPPDGRLDDAAELSQERYRRDIRALATWLRAAPVGTFVLTYNGFGGRLPPDFENVRMDRALPNVLRLSRKLGGGRSCSATSATA